MGKVVIFPKWPSCAVYPFGGGHPQGSKIKEFISHLAGLRMSRSFDALVRVLAILGGCRHNAPSFLQAGALQNSQPPTAMIIALVGDGLIVYAVSGAVYAK